MNTNVVIDTSLLLPEHKIQVERIKALYKQAYSILTGGLLVAALLAFVLFKLTENNLTLYWLVVLLGFTAFRYLMVREYFRGEYNDIEIIRWGWFFAVTTFISGCIWGATSILFLDPHNLIVMLVLLMTMTGITVGSSASLANFAWSYYAFAIPTLLPFVYVLILEGSVEFSVLGAMLMVFLILQLAVARRNQNTIDESIILRNENIGLIQQLRLEKDKALSESAAKTRFLAAASHDLRQPLHAMGLFLDILSEQSQESKQDSIIGKIKKSSVALENLLESLLDISRLDAGVVGIENKPFYIQSLFDVLANEFQSIALEKNLNIHFMPGSLCINSDKQAVDRILRNLVSNAIRYTEHGKVLIGCRRRSESIVVSVYDTGIGIDADKTEIIFEEFQQLNNHSRDRSKGLGLGLSIVQRLCGLLEAKLSLQSVPGKGSVFSVELPRCLSADITQPDYDVLDEQEGFVGKFIVIVEDEIEIREGLNLLLSGWGCEVVELTCVADIKNKMKHSHQPDLILADYRLPDYETGVDVIHAIYDYYADSDIPAVIITGDTSPERIKEAGESGFSVMHKPVSGGKLRALLNSLLLSK